MRIVKALVVMLLMTVIIACGSEQASNEADKARIGSSLAEWEAYYGKPTRDNGNTQGFLHDYLWIDFTVDKVAFGGMVQFGKTDEPSRSEEEADDIILGVLPEDAILEQEAVNRESYENYYIETDLYTSELLRETFGPGRIRVGKTVLTDQGSPVVSTVNINYQPE
jgi:hypothetical protein